MASAWRGLDQFDSPIVEAAHEVVDSDPTVDALLLASDVFDVILAFTDLELVIFLDV